MSDPNQMSQEEKDFWNDETTIPKSNWFNFTNVGDSVSGELVESFPHEGKYGMQQVYVLRLPNGDEVNVSLKHTTHKIQVQQLKRAEPGDVLGFRLKELVDTGKGNPAKSVEVRVRHVAKKEE